MAEPILKDSVEIGLGRLIDQFEEKPNVVGTLQSFLENTQNIETEAFEVNTAFDLMTAVGVQLDTIGRLVNELREGRLDDEYRSALLNRVKVNSADGTIANIIDIVASSLPNLVDPIAGVNLIEHFPADIHVYVQSVEDESLHNLIDEITPAGVTRTMGFIPESGEVLTAQEIEISRRFLFTGAGDQIVTDDGVGGKSDLVVSNIIASLGEVANGYLGEIIPSEGERSNVLAETLRLS